MSELFEQLPEVGDLDKPKLVFFFDEAHLLFNDAPKALLDKIEQVVRLIRSKGVGVYFVTQNPLDVPDKVLAQLGNRVQHALRAFTPRDQKAVRAAAETFRANPKLDTAKVITELGKGEALVSFLEGNGMPVDGRARPDPSAVRARRAGHAGGAQGGDREEPDQGQVRSGDRPGIGLRDPAEARMQDRPHAAGDGKTAAGRRAGRAERGPRPGGARRHARHRSSARHAARQRLLDRGRGRARGHALGHQPRSSVRSPVDIGKSVGGSMAGSVGRAIVRGALVDPAA